MISLLSATVVITSSMVWAVATAVWAVVSVVVAATCLYVARRTIRRHVSHDDSWPFFCLITCMPGLGPFFTLLDSIDSVREVKTGRYVGDEEEMRRLPCHYALLLYACLWQPVAAGVIAAHAI